MTILINLGVLFLCLIFGLLFGCAVANWKERKSTLTPEQRKKAFDVEDQIRKGKSINQVLTKEELLEAGYEV